MVFGHLNNSKTCVLFIFILICYKDQVVIFSQHLEQVSRTNLFKLSIVWRKFMFFELQWIQFLVSSIVCSLFDIRKHWYQFQLIWIKFPIVTCLCFLFIELLENSINEAFGFSSTKLCQNIYVTCGNKLIHSTTFVFKLARLEKHLKIFWFSIKECLSFLLNNVGKIIKCSHLPLF